jgi:hypothetical protein
MRRSSNARTDGISSTERRLAYGSDLLAEARLTRESFFSLVACAGVREPSCAERAAGGGEGGVSRYGT